MKGSVLTEWSNLLSVIAHPTRLLILHELVRGMKCVNDIRELLDIPQPNVSQHLAILKKKGLVISHKDGNVRCYHLAKPKFIKDLFTVLEKKYPVVKLGDPKKCREKRKSMVR
jgi:ArsR family transcriptional regulator